MNVDEQRQVIEFAVKQFSDAVCSSHVGIGCPYSYDCAIRECNTQLRTGFIRTLTEKGAVLKVEGEWPASPYKHYRRLRPREFDFSAAVNEGYSRSKAMALRAGFTDTAPLIEPEKPADGPTG